MRKRLIPVLLVDRDKRLVKTVQFGKRTYVGDPFNVIRLFNEKEVDELIVLDIDATLDGRIPDFNFIRELANECFMPLAYGGGISALAHIEKLNKFGVEKYVFGNNALTNRTLLQEASRFFGQQSITVCVDTLFHRSQIVCTSHSGRNITSLTPIEFCLSLQDAGVGEIVLQSIDRDGMRNGCDLELISALTPQLSVPLVSLGGAGDSLHLVQALKAGAMAAASGSAFCFIGRLRAVLISYPDQNEIELLLKES